MARSARRRQLETAKELRERLAKCLNKLGRIRPTDLVREEALGSPLSFRAGIPFFDRTLRFYRQLADVDLTRVPSPILEIAATHAEESLRQFEQIETFDPTGIDRPEQIRNILINDVRDAHAVIYEDLCMLLAPGRGQMEKVPRGPGRLWMTIVVALILAGVVVGYQYSLFDNFINYVQYAVHHSLSH
jgi:hypothetical protein